MKQQRKHMQSSYRILFISDLFWPFVGGAENYSRVLLSKLAERGLRICALSHQFYGTKSYETRGNLKIYRERLSFSERNLDFFRRIVFYLKSFLIITRHVLKNQPDLLIAQQLISVPAIFASKLFRVPAIIILHDYWPICYYRSLLDSHERICSTFDRRFHDTYLCVKNHLNGFFTKSLLKPIMAATYSLLVYLHTLISRQILDKANTIVVVSRFLEKVLILNGIDSKKIRVIYNPITVDCSWGNKSTNMPYALYVGRLETEKGVKFLIEAAEQVCMKLKEFKLFIVGDGPLRKSLQPLSRSLGIEHRVEFLGRVSGTSLDYLYRSSAVVVVPSIWAEPFGRVVAEAMMYNRPVVASSVGAIPEILDKKKGFLVPPKNPKALADAIVSAISKKTSPESRICPKFSPDDIATQYLSVIQSVMRARQNA